MPPSEDIKINWILTDPENPLHYDLAYPLLVLHRDLNRLMLDDLQQLVAEVLSKKRGLAAKPYELWFYRPKRATALQELNTVEWFKKKANLEMNFRLCQPTEPLTGDTPDEAKSIGVAKELHFMVQFSQIPPSMSEYDLW